MEIVQSLYRLIHILYYWTLVLKVNLTINIRSMIAFLYGLFQLILLNIIIILKPRNLVEYWGGGFE